MAHGPSDLFRILGVENRLGILSLLSRRGPQSTSAIARQLRVTPAAVSQHLALLRSAGLVKRDRRGFTVPYSVDPRGLDECCGHLVAVCSCGCGCHGPAGGSGATIAELRRRARDLRKELTVVEARIRRLEGRGGRPDCSTPPRGRRRASHGKER